MRLKYWNSEFLAWGIALWILDSKRQYQLLTQFSAYQPVLWSWNLPVSTVIIIQFLKINLSIIYLSIYPFIYLSVIIGSVFLGSSNLYTWSDSLLIFPFVRLYQSFWYTCYHSLSAPLCSNLSSILLSTPSFFMLLDLCPCPSLSLKPVIPFLSW